MNIPHAVDGVNESIPIKLIYFSLFVVFFLLSSFVVVFFSRFFAIHTQEELTLFLYLPGLLLFVGFRP